MKPRPANRRLLRWVALLGAAALALSSLGSASTLRRELEPGLVAQLSDRPEIYLEALPEAEEGLLAFARRLCGDSKAAPLIRELNGGSKSLLAGVRYRVRLEWLRPELQHRVLEALFPEDDAGPDGWVHVVAPRRSESLWQIAEWFTGKGEHYRAIRDGNRLSDEQIQPRQEILIPASLLQPPFADLVARHQAALALAASSDLEYGDDGEGAYAAYRLRAGEALYSSVVVRFTGRLFAEDVNQLAGEIAERSEIDDVTDIPVGYTVKIPLDLLSPQFLPPGHAGRQAYDEQRSASARFSNQVRTLDLAGVTVILDAGHGGRDVGASRRGVWESVYVYDIMLRTRRALEERTAARVVSTTQGGSGLKIEPRDKLSLANDHKVLTSPPYEIEDARAGTNLRWYLSNSIFHREVRAGRDAHEVVFVSIHADSLHSSLRGAMVYVPGLLPTLTDYGKSGTVYASRREVQEHPKVSFTKRERIRSEGLSRELAGHLIDSFRRHQLAIHPNQPVRDKIVRRRGRPWVPAVLRNNAVPAKVLVEVCNLANPEDLELIQTRSYRQKVADALVAGLLAYYDGDAVPRPTLTASGALAAR